MLGIVFSFIIVLGGSAMAWLWLDHKLKQMKHLKRYERIHKVRREEAKVKNNIHGLRARFEDEQVEFKARMANLNKEYESKEQLIEEASLDVVVLEAGLFNLEYDFIDSQTFRQKLKENRSQQKTLIRSKNATYCDREWIVDGSAEAGKKMIQEKMILMLRAFNGECDNFISRVTYRNGNAMSEKIEKAFGDINKLGEEKQCFLSDELLKLKQEELRLVYGYNERKEQEREEQRQLREQMKEEKKVLEEIGRAKKEAENEELRLQEALQIARSEIADKDDAEKAEFQKKIEALEKQLENASDMKARALSQAQLTRAGHVYIISNVGSFGDNVYKIGLTRRLEPTDRVKELGDASVPFSYDIHAMVYSKDAPTLEKSLHDRFSSYRVNRVNERKEFFRVSLDEIAKEVKRVNEDITFTMVAEARDYRESIRMQQSKDELEVVS